MSNVAFERFLKSLPDDVVDSFNTRQLSAMSAAFKQESRRHPVDIRVTIPLLWKKFFLVILAGPERRSLERRRAERAKHPIWTPTNALVTIAFIGLGLLLSTGVWQLKLAAQDILSPERIEDAYPAIIPFKESQQDCVASGRSWEDGQCIDYGHDRNF